MLNRTYFSIYPRAKTPPRRVRTILSRKPLQQYIYVFGSQRSSIAINNNISYAYINTLYGVTDDVEGTVSGQVEFTDGETDGVCPCIICFQYYEHRRKRLRNPTL